MNCEACNHAVHLERDRYIVFLFDGKVEYVHEDCVNPEILEKMF